MRENNDLNNTEYGHFSRSVSYHPKCKWRFHINKKNPEPSPLILFKYTNKDDRVKSVNIHLHFF